jgi:transcriptional regulator with XRE-family HTH domain
VRSMLMLLIACQQTQVLPTPVRGVSLQGSECPILTDMSDIGAQIRAARQAQRMTIQELAKRAGVDQRTVGRIELGESPRPSKAGLLQKVLKIGPYAPPPPERDALSDPPLSEATFAQLLQALESRHEDALRAAER